MLSNTFRTFTVIVVALLTLSFSSNAQEEPEFTQKQIDNLISGINSQNEGLMRSSVYFAGKYHVEEAVEPLIQLLENEKEESNIILIALALYQIGDENAMMKVLETAQASDRGKAKRMLTAISVEYFSEQERYSVTVME